MTYLEVEENEYDKISERYIEWKGRSFKLVCMDPHGYWKVHHATNNKPVQYIKGNYTSYGEALKALKSMPDEELPKIQQRKMILTPKVKIEEDEE